GALGVQALLTIPKAEDPTFPFANFAIVAVLPGAPPRDLERLVVDPLEARLKTLADLKTLKTEIDDSLAVVNVEFRAGVDPDKKRDEVQREVTSLRPTLPSDLQRLEVKQFNAAQVNILEIALLSDGTAGDVLLDETARRLKKRLESVGGVDEVTLAGLPPLEVAVELDLERLVALGVSPSEVLAAIGGEAVNLPAGSIDAGARRLSVKATGDFPSVEAVRRTIVRNGGGRQGAIRVEDLAKVERRRAEATQLARFDGQPAVLLAINQREGQNVFDTRRAIAARLAEAARDLPASLRLVQGFDQSDNVSHRLGGLGRDFTIAILLVLLTLLPLGLRASFVVMLSIPLSLALGLFLLQLAGFSLNQLSIVGFVIALGLLVDDSVVVVENIARFLREGRPPREAAIEATRQIALSVLGCTATLLFAFLPLLALPGTAGLFIKSLPVAVVFTVAASLLVAMTVVPFLASRLLRPEREEGNVFFRGLTWVIAVSYRRVLQVAVRSPKATVALSFALVLASLALVPRIGFSLFPKAGIPQFLVSIETADGASLEETDRAARFVEAQLRRHPEVRKVAAVVGKGHPQIYYNVVPRNERSNAADVFAEVDLEALRGDGALAGFFETLRGELAYAGARIEVKEFENGPPLEAPLAIRLLGDDADRLRETSAQVARVLASVEGTRDVDDPGRKQQLDLRVEVDHDKAALFGVMPHDVDRALRLAVGGVVAGRYRAPSSDEAEDLRVTLSRGGERSLGGGPRPEVGVLERLWVEGRTGAVPLPQVAAMHLEPSPATLRHYLEERSVTVTAQVRPGYNTDRLAKEVQARLSSVQLPRGVRTQVAGELENRQESFGGLGTAILVAVFGVLAVLVLEFRTFKGTLIVASVVPLGVVGGLLALWLSGNTLSFTAVVGFIALMGIEVKNSILLVDFTNHLRERGVPLDEAIAQAGEVRFVPILLTTLTAIGGLVPLVLERSSLYSPLALVILGGLVSSTLLARLVTPVLYKLLPPELEPRPAEGHAAVLDAEPA
ncbi:MAG: efflux RND transporter permease subunit, partial [Deltaproteobacteria bacterium]|nr:efflux RND transporter permease subunit [Deltaproteobacteria bacterium]